MKLTRFANIVLHIFANFNKINSIFCEISHRAEWWYVNITFIKRCAFWKMRIIIQEEMREK